MGITKRTGTLWVFWHLAGLLEGSPNAVGISEWKNGQDGSGGGGVCAVGVGLLLGGSLDKALYQARLPK